MQNTTAQQANVIPFPSRGLEKTLFVPHSYPNNETLLGRFTVKDRSCECFGIQEGDMVISDGMMTEIRDGGLFTIRHNDGTVTAGSIHMDAGDIILINAFGICRFPQESVEILGKIMMFQRMLYV